MAAHELRTPRLRLVQLDPAEARALRERGRGGVAAPWADEYPLPGTWIAVGLELRAHAEGRDLGPWGTYQVVRRADGRVIGDAGFHGPPDPDGSVEVGYGIVPSARRQGYATEALRALLDLARARPEARCVRAEAEASNTGSWRAMERAGMRRVRERDGLVVYALPVGGCAAAACG
jgi:RimJ/RimL family protein N-acetyltransferase